MERLYEVYDNEQVQLVTRRQAFVTSVSLAAAVAATVSLAVLLQEAVLRLPAVLTLAALVWSLAIHRVIRHRRSTNHVAWCIKISGYDVTGYDYARRKTTIPWEAVRRIELGPHGLTLHGEEAERIEIPHLFTDFPALSHRLFDRAQTHGVPVTIEGEAWEQLDVYELFPFLSAAAASGGRDAPSGSLRDP